MAQNPLASLPGLPQRPSLARSSASETRLTQPGIEGARSRKLISAPTAAFRIKDGVEVFLPDALEANGLVELSFRGRVLLEPSRKVGAEFGFVALGVERRPAALRGRERDLGSSVLENVVGGSELFEPEAGLATRVAQLIVGCQHHEYSHILTP